MRVLLDVLTEPLELALDKSLKQSWIDYLYSRDVVGIVLEALDEALIDSSCIRVIGVVIHKTSMVTFTVVGKLLSIVSVLTLLFSSAESVLLGLPALVLFERMHSVPG